MVTNVSKSENAPSNIYEYVCVCNICKRVHRKQSSFKQRKSKISDSRKSLTKSLATSMRVYQVNETSDTHMQTYIQTYKHTDIHTYS